jgi:hypothetical protein
MKYPLLISLCLLAVWLTPVLAQPEHPAPPPLPEDLQDIEGLTDTEVTIIHREDEVVEEVRIGGQLRYIKVTPKKGPPYYFIDTDGDGQLDTKRHELDNPTINQWILKRW